MCSVADNLEHYLNQFVDFSLSPDYTVYANERSQYVEAITPNDDRPDAITPPYTRNMGNTRPFATPSTPTFTPSTNNAHSAHSAYSINPKWTMKTWTDGPATPSFKFARPITPSVSSRSTTPCSSSIVDRDGPTVNFTSQEVAKAVQYLHDNLKREYDEKMLEMEYRLRDEYLEKSAVEREVELERVREECRVEFEKILQERMTEVVEDYNQQLDEGRIEFEEVLRERMAEVQAACNATVRQKDRQIARLKWEMIAGETPRASRSRSHRERTRDRERRAWTIEDESEDARTYRTVAVQADEDHNVPQYVKDLPIDGPNGLRSKFFNLQLELALERTRFLEIEEELKQRREEVEKYQHSEREMKAVLHEYEQQQRQRQQRQDAVQLQFNSSAPPSPSPSPPSFLLSLPNPTSRAATTRKSSFSVHSTPPTPTLTPSASPNPPNNRQQQRQLPQRKEQRPSPEQVVVIPESRETSPDDEEFTISEYDLESEFGPCRWDQLRYPESSEADEEIDELDEDVV